MRTSFSMRTAFGHASVAAVDPVVRLRKINRSDPPGGAFFIVFLAPSRLGRRFAARFGGSSRSSAHLCLCASVGSKNCQTRASTVYGAGPNEAVHHPDELRVVSRPCGRALGSVAGVYSKPNKNHQRDDVPSGSTTC